MKPPTILILHGPTQGVPTHSQHPLGAACPGNQPSGPQERLQAPKRVNTALRPAKPPFKAFRGVFKAMAINARTALVAIGVATNADVPAISAEAGDGWLLLAPYGDTDYWHEEKPGEWKCYTQVFGQPQAAKMVAAFNATLAKKGARFRGLPIYEGHPDADPKRWTNERRFGGVMAMDARADGLYLRAAWNDLGQQNLAQGYLVYPSPAWLYNMRDAKRTGRIEPDELRSVGLTNSPRIADVDAWTNSDATPDPNAEDTMINKLLTKILGVAEDATEDQIQTAYNAHFTGDVTAISLKATATNAETAKGTAEAAKTAAEGQVATVTTERNTARTEATRFRDVAVNALLDSAINTGRLTAAERPAFAQQFATNFDAASTALGAKKAVLPQQQIDVRRDATGDLSTTSSRRTAFNVRVDELMAERKVSFEQATAAMRHDAVGKQILEAMEKADQEAAAKAK